MQRSVYLSIVVVIALFLWEHNLAYAITNTEKNKSSKEVNGTTGAEAPKIIESELIERIPASEFTYGGSQRYTMGGSLPPLETNIKPVEASIVGGVYTGAVVGLHVLQANAWWSGQRRSFHFQDDWDFALQVDKAGHFVGGYTLSYFMGEALLASGFSWDAAMTWGGALGLLYQTYVEVQDGHATDWGFSVSDMASNTVGAGFFVAQHYVPYLQNFSPKWQYIPANLTGDTQLTDHPTAIVDDYNSSTFWMSMNVHNMLPEDMQQYWLPWLQVAVGYGARGIGNDQERRRLFVVGLDYNMVELLPEGGAFWNWIRQSLNFIKFPAPALEFGKVTKFKLLYPFEISLGNVRL